jgi:hypothetical protein
MAVEKGVRKSLQMRKQLALQFKNEMIARYPCPIVTIIARNRLQGVKRQKSNAQNGQLVLRGRIQPEQSRQSDAPIVDRQVDALDFRVRPEQDIDHVLEGKGKGEREREFPNPHKGRPHDEPQIRPYTGKKPDKW